MFFNLGGAEVLVIAMVALIAVGPEQLPTLLRKIGRFMAQARSMTAGLRQEFMSGLDEVRDVANPEAWMGSGSDDDPVVPRGYANANAAPDANANAAPDSGPESEPGSASGKEVDAVDVDTTQAEPDEAAGSNETAVEDGASGSERA